MAGTGDGNDDETSKKRNREDIDNDNDGEEGKPATSKSAKQKQDGDDDIDVVMKGKEVVANADALFGGGDSSDDEASNASDGQVEIYLDEEEGEDEDLPDRVILREETTTLELPADGTYTAKLQLIEFWGTPEIKEISVKLYFTSNKDEKMQEEAVKEEEEVGYLSGFLLPRPSPNFYDFANAVSDELSDLASMFCNRQGHLVDSKVNTGLPASTKGGGGFLQIYSLEVMGPNHTGRDLGLHLVDQTLTFLKGDDSWDIAVMVPCLLGVQIQRWPDCHNRLKIDPDALEHSTTQTEGLKKAHVAIKRHFCRMGFQQAGRNSEQHHAFYVTAPDYFGSGNKSKGWKTKEDVKSLDIFVAPDKHEPTGVDAELHEAILGDPVDVKLIQNLVQKKGASLHNARAVFMAAAENDVTLLKLLVEDLGGTVNEADENGNGPLHVAAMMMHVEAIEYLVSNANAGAAKDARNDRGHTPLQTLEESILAMLEDEDVVVDDRDKKRHSKCRELLRV